MKTAIVSTCWLGNDDYIKKTAKFLKYYSQSVHKALGSPDLWLVDNASPPEGHRALDGLWGTSKVKWKRYDKHYTRSAHLEYPYLWRALYFCRDLFQEHDYEKVIFADNDAYIISNNMADVIKQTKNTAWWSPFCTKHGFAETGIQIIGSNNTEYWDLTRKPYVSYNGLTMETTLPVTKNKTLVGDRFSEYGIDKQVPGWDFSTQTTLEMDIKYNG